MQGYLCCVWTGAYATPNETAGRPRTAREDPVQLFCRKGGAQSCLCSTIASVVRASALRRSGVRPSSRSCPSPSLVREIRKFQKSCELLIRRAPFQRLVRELANKGAPGGQTDFRWKAEALEALQEAAEAYLVSKAATYPAGRVRSPHARYVVCGVLVLRGDPTVGPHITSTSRWKLCLGTMLCSSAVDRRSSGGASSLLLMAMILYRLSWPAGPGPHPTNADPCIHRWA